MNEAVNTKQCVNITPAVETQRVECKMNQLDYDEDS